MTSGDTHPPASPSAENDETVTDQVERFRVPCFEIGNYDDVYALECIILHVKFQKFSGGYTPVPPWREGATPSLHSAPTPSTAKGRARGRATPPAPRSQM